MAGFGFSIGDIVLVSNLALSIYKSSKQAGKEFRSIADDVASLQTSLRGLHEEVEKPHSLVQRSSALQRRELTALMASCRADLEDIGDKLDNFKSLRKGNPRKRDKLRFTPNTQAEIRTKIATHSDRLNRFLNGLNTSALGRVEGNTERHILTYGQIVAKLDTIHQDVLNGRRNPSILTNMEDWVALEQELVDDNITEVDVETNRDEIEEWLEYIRGKTNLKDTLRDIIQNEDSRVSTPRPMEYGFSSNSTVSAKIVPLQVKSTNNTNAQRLDRKEGQVKNVERDDSVSMVPFQPVRKEFQATVEDCNSDNSGNDRHVKQHSVLAAHEERIKQQASGVQIAFHAMAEDYRSSNGGHASEKSAHGKQSFITQDGPPSKQGDVEDSANRHDYMPELPKGPSNDTHYHHVARPRVMQHQRRMKSNSGHLEVGGEDSQASDPKLLNPFYSAAACALGDKKSASQTALTTNKNHEAKDVFGNILCAMRDDTEYDADGSVDSDCHDYETSLLRRRRPDKPTVRSQQRKFRPPIMTSGLPVSPGELVSFNSSNANYIAPCRRHRRRLFNAGGAYSRFAKFPSIHGIIWVTPSDILKRELRTIVNGETILLPVDETVRVGYEAYFPDQGLRFSIREMNEPYIRHDDTLFYEIKLFLHESLCGFQRQIPLIDGAPKLLSYCGFVSPEWTTVLKEQGIPTIKDPKKRGDLVVCIAKIIYPEKLTRAQNFGLRNVFWSNFSERSNFLERSNFSETRSILPSVGPQGIPELRWS